MNCDEHKQIIKLINSAVADPTIAVVPVDVEADAVIRALFVRNPDAAYRITMLALNQTRELAWLRTQIQSTTIPVRKGLAARLLWFVRFFRRHDGQAARL